ncbi:Mitochondrial import inner membrane translocase subunit tim21 [Schizosaccharomyces pombe]|uniref:Mitochondrial import inner membrane translocase subunit tim21 n=1 Tax=Schizosaccharomyces pombe (strain 972 / ATCC 24843) TaxID=284812 RepID=TIM21_SCHPO|nr:putative TIM23 translocase complex subunit Tim21 [Schizosaccharomyces pombe]O94618.1 RecName: Full=Mitochondrial import inner membrane translocase subunit tim21; Flags: Precursor [Schizosaccharomyces pombe 972h-]CAB38689.1 TIM23 translocase complex subunit Tim21 (predicted) [Schizosaccharomyces pombe]|eukprot:NP_596833.1 putative TIM23 translocase complex subunit Tim21 [Schizosaccharomyces pombe]
MIRTIQRQSATRFSSALVQRRLYSLASDSLNKQRKPQEEGRLARIFKDPSNKAWKDLTAPQKAYRTSANIGNFSIVIFGGGVFGLIIYALVTSIWKGEAHYGDEAFELLKANEECRYVFGDHMKALGEATHPLRRTHGILTSRVWDHHGVEHLVLQFHLIGNERKGHVFGRLVNVQGDYKWEYLFVDVANYGKIIIFDHTNSVRQQHKNFGLWGSLKNITWGN